MTRASIYLEMAVKILTSAPFFIECNSKTQNVTLFYFFKRNTLYILTLTYSLLIAHLSNITLRGLHLTVSNAVQLFYYDPDIIEENFSCFF